MTKKAVELEVIIDEFAYDNFIFKTIDFYNLQKEQINIEINAVFHNYQDKERSKLYSEHPITYYRKGHSVYFLNKTIDAPGFKI